MGRFTLAFKVWWRVLTDQVVADRVRPLVDAAADGKTLPAPTRPTAPTAAAPTTPAATLPTVRIEPQRNDALNLLAVLQREARFVDFFKEDLAGYGDEQIGKAARDVHRDTASVLERLFALRPVMADKAEGSAVEVPAGSDAGRVRLTGNVTGQPPFRGTLQHAGWEAGKVQLPEWSGGEASARVVAPAEVELK